MPTAGFSPASTAPVEEITSHLERYDLGLASQKIYDFIWSELCDWYIEMAKPRLYGDSKREKDDVLSVLVHVLGETLKLLHPFMPFISEEIYTHLPCSEETIMRSAWPRANPAFAFPEESAAMAGIMGAITAVRNIRAEMNVAPSKRTHQIVVATPERVRAFEQTEAYLQKLASASSVEIRTDKEGIPADAVSVVCEMGEIYIPLAELVNLEKERERLSKEKKNVEGEIARAQAKLGNPGFTGKAPAKVVEETRAALLKNQALLAKICERLESLSKV